MKKNIQDLIDALGLNSRRYSVDELVPILNRKIDGGHALIYDTDGEVIWYKKIAGLVCRNYFNFLAVDLDTADWGVFGYGKYCEVMDANGNIVLEFLMDNAPSMKKATFHIHIVIE